MSFRVDVRSSWLSTSTVEQCWTSSAKSQLGSSLQDILVFADQAGLCQRLLDFVETCAMWTPEIRCGKKCPTWINILEEIEVAIANWCKLGCKLGTAKFDGCFLIYPTFFIIFPIFYVFFVPSLRWLTPGFWRKLLRVEPRTQAGGANPWNTQYPRISIYIYNIYTQYIVYINLFCNIL